MIRVCVWCCFTGKEKMVKGLLCEYAPKPGQVYYRDLSGKLKQVNQFLKFQVAVFLFI